MTRVHFISNDRHAGMALGEIAAQEVNAGDLWRVCELNQVRLQLHLVCGGSKRPAAVRMTISPISRSWC